MKASHQTRLDLLAALAKLGRLRPDWRLGQLMANLAMTAGRLESGAVWDLEDWEALEAAKTLIGHHPDAEMADAEAPHDLADSRPTNAQRPAVVD